MMMLNFDFVLRLLVAGILGAIIGLDREYRAKEAGYRTHFLVSLGSALIMIVAQYGFQEIIKERLNPRKHRQDMPVRYWKYLTEKQT